MTLAFVLLMYEYGGHPSCWSMPVGDDYDWRDVYKSGEINGYPSLEQYNDALAYLLFKYPGLLRREPIGESVEGRTIFAYKLTAESNNPDISPPRVLLISLLHGTEPVTALISLFTIGTLLEDFQNNITDAQYLLRTRELHVIPIANPDAYAAGCKIGEFKFRKNRRDTCPSNSEHSGVDLNRNFGLYWSSEVNSSPCHTEYGGSSPFSEPETRAIYDYVGNYTVQSTLLLHSYGEIIAYPFNGNASASVSDTHKSFYHGLQKVFGIEKAGPSPEVLKYSTNGEATDFLYGSRGIVALSLEAGPEADGFVPPIDRGVLTAERNYGRIKYWMLKSGCEIVDMSVSPSEDGAIDIKFLNSGLSPPIGDIKVAALSSRSEDILSASFVTKQGKIFTPGWSDQIRIEISPDSILPDTFCWIELELMCRCFQVTGGTSESYIHGSSRYVTHAELCGLLGVGLETVSRTAAQISDDSYSAYMWASVFLMSLFGLLLLRTIRGVFKKS